MAAGPTLIRFPARDAEGLGRSSTAPRSARRNLHYVIRFDGTVASSCNWTGILPQQYGGSGVTIRIHFASDEILASKTAIYRTRFERIGQSQDIDIDSFASNIAKAHTLNTTPGIVEVMEIVHTDGSQMDNLVAGELFRLNVERNGSFDNSSADTYVTHVELTETA